ncbi:hypothetical protein PDG61_24435 [Mycolicibacterium sp. BiH015]|uniref:hypothetical protein n=1 Tax=Mycolicibacterium sp. BiH015 TaxID=3018808 RepID=UPI0022E8C221|nr:hypothetical protein [Mycolicibacterium sp. BiH015]MDA2894078.1 hypothetical protein [Mycolicibacterium sp. BiH015]
MPGGKTVIELRVHGVSGTPPEAMLSCPKEFRKQVGGDADAGFFRRHLWVDRAADPPRDGTWWRRMEAYSWGGLTSRRASRAVWLLFLPFSLINLAHWMLPPARRPVWAAGAVTVLRLLALSFTLTLLLAMAVAVLDVAVWQCTTLPYCSAGWGPLALLSAAPMGVRLAIGALPLVAVIGALWLLGREETIRVDEPASAPPSAAHTLIDNSAPPPEAVVGEADPSPLSSTDFWNADDAVRCMRACHVTAWTAGLGAVVLVAPVTAHHGGVTGAVDLALMAANLALLAVAIVATASTKATGRGGDAASETTGSLLNNARWLALIANAATLIWVGITYRPELSAAAPNVLPGLHTTIYVLTAVQVILLAALGIAIAMSRTHRAFAPGYQPTLGGYTAWFVALLGWLIGAGFSAGVGLWTAEVLGTWVVSAEDAASMLLLPTEAAPLMVPRVYVWASVGAVIVLIVAVVAVVRLLRTVMRADADGETSEAARKIESSVSAAVSARIRRARQFASLTEHGPGLIACLVAVAVMLVFVAAVLLYLAITAVDTFVEVVLARVAVGATVVIVAAFVGLVVLAVRNRQTRRSIAILWDVITFWPRANHPLTPPSYGGRTVFDLRLRMRVLRESADPTEVVLVAHSQGTIIAAATLMQATGRNERYPLLTFGAPLRRLYSCNFPAYFGREALDKVRRLAEPEGANRWINLWAHTDPIGGWVFAKDAVYVDGEPVPKEMAAMATDVDCRIFDVQQVFPRIGEYDIDPGGKICGHSGFWERAEFVKAIAALQVIVAPESAPYINRTPPPTERAY